MTFKIMLIYLYINFKLCFFVSNSIELSVLFEPSEPSDSSDSSEQYEYSELLEF